MSHTILRIAAVMCFVGHGAFGIITKPVWCNYFAVIGIGHDMAYRMMPVVGSIDILLGLSLLVYPVRAVAGWLVVWGIVTASLRPLSGEPFAELIERAGNYGAPLVLLLLSIEGERGFKGWFSKLRPASTFSTRRLQQINLFLRIAVFLLLTGHGWLNLVEKKGLIQQYAGLGFPNPLTVARYAGVFEIAAALIILIRPVRPLLLALFVWKMGTELFYPHWEIFEWVERGGSYGCLLALWVMETGARKIRKTNAAFGTAIL